MTDQRQTHPSQLGELLARLRRIAPLWLWGAGLVAALFAGILGGLPAIAILITWAVCWAGNTWIARTTAGRWLAPVIFGLTLLILWEITVRLYAVPTVILPAPTQIAVTLAANLPTLWADFVQTVVKGALTGWLIGCGAGIATGLLVARSDVLRRGLLPVGNFVAALPIVGTAPILVMWFGFGWESKAAVVVVMVFFPMLVNTVAGLADTTAMQRDLMRTYGATPGQDLRYLKLQAALPFIFNGLKIATTLALIGAIVAEFFGSPTVGLGFRISTEVGRLNLPMVWASIVTAALAGSLSYGLIAALEKHLTFWHPSQRARG
ncbi:ABC transporter permease [Jannaschia sp. AI_61]|nr:MULTISPECIES: ABC transporter permease [unclassified Jannaschia]GIT90718.1 ABC transporter permease [Jannaschia sp. AI_61]